MALIDDLLDLARVEAGHLTFADEAFDVAELLESSLELVRESARRKNLELRIARADETPGFLHGDVRRLRQILVNLLTNAIKFTHAGSVTLRYSRDGSAPCAAAAGDQGAVLFSVEDTGIGIHRDKLEVIFASFVQGDERDRKSVV